MTGITDYFRMEEHSLLFGVISFLFVVSLILFANLCVKLEKKKQPSPTANNVQSKSKGESQRVLLQSMESGVQNEPTLNLHLSTNSSHYTDKRYRSIPNSTERSPRSIPSSPRSTNSSEHSASGQDLNRYRVGSESQKVKRDNAYIDVSHKRQNSLEVPHSKQSRYTHSASYKKPIHLPHELLKRTEHVLPLTRDNSFRSSSGSTGSSHKRNYPQLRSTVTGSGTVITGTLPIESATPRNSASDSQSESSKYHMLTSFAKPLVPKYSESKLKGTPVRIARLDPDPDPSEDFMDSLSPSRDSSQATYITLQSPSHNRTIVYPAIHSEDVNSMLSSQFPNSRAVKRQLSYEDSNCYPPYYRPSIDSTCQLYSTQSNKNLPLRMRFPKLSSTGTDFADDETEGTSVCQSLYSSYTSLYQTDTEEFMLGEPQVLKLSRELESPFLPDVPGNDQRTPLVAHYAKHYTEDLMRNGRCHTNMSEYSDSDISFVWQGDDLGKHEYTPHEAQLLNDRRNMMFPRHMNRKQGYTDYSGGLSFFSFVSKDSIPEEIQSIPIQPNSSQSRAMVSPSRFVGYPKFAKSTSYNVPGEVYTHSMEKSRHNIEDKVITSSRNVSKSSENIKLTLKQSLVRDNSNSHPNLRVSKPQSHYYDYTKQEHVSLDTPPPLHPKVGSTFNRNNSNNDLDNVSGGSLTHL